MRLDCNKQLFVPIIARPFSNIPSFEHSATVDHLCVSICRLPREKHFIIMVPVVRIVSENSRRRSVLSLFAASAPPRKREQMYTCSSLYVQNAVPPCSIFVFGFSGISS
ncbi:hypothetical protein L596_005766 [Steinernema carpocapsae]|uniref:Uncharacterized protein n=1 Tax=Steinernema carpocapsae TaxID=34508 RepID=A0A4U8V062_STECR|nr:hypothetical protein L596_005766 [Steinernema carpocapsae]